MFMVLILS